MRACVFVRAYRLHTLEEDAVFIDTYGQELAYIPHCFLTSVWTLCAGALLADHTLRRRCVHRHVRPRAGPSLGLDDGRLQSGCKGAGGSGAYCR